MGGSARTTASARLTSRRRMHVPSAVGTGQPLDAVAAAQFRLQLAEDARGRIRHQAPEVVARHDEIGRRCGRADRVAQHVEQHLRRGLRQTDIECGQAQRLPQALHQRCRCPGEELARGTVRRDAPAAQAPAQRPLQQCQTLCCAHAGCAERGREQVPRCGQSRRADRVPVGVAHLERQPQRGRTRRRRCARAVPGSGCRRRSADAGRCRAHSDDRRAPARRGARGRRVAVRLRAA